MYKQLEYSENCSVTSKSLWNYYRDEAKDSTNKIDNIDDTMNNNKTRATKYFKYKKK